MAIVTSIMLALFERLDSLPGDLPVAWPNKAFDPPADDRFLRVDFIPNGTERRLIASDGVQRHQGLLQVSVYEPQGRGEREARLIADAVADHFPTDLRLMHDGVSTRINKRPEIASLMLDGGRIQIPVTVSWETWA